jgi:hypothetical protein
VYGLTKSSSKLWCVWTDSGGKKKSEKLNILALRVYSVVLILLTRSRLSSVELVTTAFLCDQF